MRDILESETDAGANNSVSHGKKDFYEHLTTLASFTGIFVAFVAALGFPSSILQFRRLQLPIELLALDDCACGSAALC